jgi:hypothetical protein
VSENELYYLTEEYCAGKILKPLAIDKFDLIKKDLGGTIMALEKMSTSNKVVYVEGDDDIDYISLILEKYKEFVDPKAVNINIYLYLRGKDYILIKLPNYVRLTQQLNGKNKELITIYDKDFSTEEANETLKSNILRKTGSNSKVFSHNGYCFESVLFSEKIKLIRFIKRFTADENVEAYANTYFFNLAKKYKDVNSEEFKELNRKFKSQNNPETRPELKKVTFIDFIREATSENGEKVHYLANKNNIRRFFELVQEKFAIQFFENKLINNRDSTYVTQIFKIYLEGITSDEDIYSSLMDLCNILKE